MEVIKKPYISDQGQVKSVSMGYEEADQKRKTLSLTHFISMSKTNQKKFKIL